MIEATLLLVDDVPKNLQLAGTILDHAGYDVLPCSNGYRALEVARQYKPDLALVDFIMPEMSGADLCRIFQEFPETKDLPVIFLTALEDSERCIEAFSNGAVDYITKPFVPAELLARVRTHLELQAARRRLELLNQEKTNLMRMVAHDLKNPLTAVSLSLSLLREVSNRNNETIDDVIETIDVHTDRMTRLVGSLLKANALEEGRRELDIENVELNPLVAHTSRMHEPICHKKSIDLLLNLEEEPVRCLVDREAFVQIVDNLISNAIKFSPPGKPVRVSLGRMGEVNRLIIEDEGPGVQPEEMEKLFSRFQRLSAKPTGGESSTGLGLSIVKELTEAMSGRVWCESLPGRGSTFMVEFPAAH